MSIDRLLNRDCTIKHRTDTGRFDDYGNIVLDVVDIDTVCELQQQSTTEGGGGGQNSGAEFVVTTHLLVLPPRTPIGAGDEVIVDDNRFEVHGRPELVRSPRTRREHHVEAGLRWTGGVAG